MKKALSVLLSLLLIISTISALPLSASAEPTEYSYTVTFTPNENFPGWETVRFSCFGGSDAWAGQMTLSDGNYTITINPDFIPIGFQIDDGGYGAYSYDLEFKADGSEIDVVTPTKIGTCTITAPSKYYVVGNGSGSWLNGVVWDPGNSANLMTEISDDVWQIEYKAVPAGLNCIFKFVADGSFQTNFGGTVSASGVTEDAVYNAFDNISFTTTKATDVIITLDLTGYDPDLKQGAKFTVTYETEEPAPPHTHSLTKVSAVEPTTAKAGHSEYYVCTCGKWFKDAAGKKEITDRQSVVIPKIVLPPEDAKLPTEAKTEEVIIKTNTDVKDIKGSQFRKLKLKATGKKKAIELSWKKIKGANGYIIYGSPCGKDIKMKKLKTIKSAKTVKYTFKKLKKGKYYKYIVVAYKITADGKKRVITKSKSAHCTTQGGKKGNPSKITVKKNKLTVKKGKTVQISGKVRSKPKMSAHIPVARFESSNTKIATVDKNGKVKGKKKGKVTIYVFTQNGIYKTVKVTVK